MSLNRDLTRANSKKIKNTGLALMYLATAKSTSASGEMANRTAKAFIFPKMLNGAVSGKKEPECNGSKKK